MIKDRYKYNRYLFQRESMEVYKQFYYRKDDSGLSDEEYDHLERLIRNTEIEHPEYLAESQLKSVNDIVGTNRAYDYVVNDYEYAIDAIRDIRAEKYVDMLKPNSNKHNENKDK